MILFINIIIITPMTGTKHFLSFRVPTTFLLTARAAQTEHQERDNIPAYSQQPRQSIKRVTTFLRTVRAARTEHQERDNIPADSEQPRQNIRSATTFLLTASSPDRA